MWVWGGGRAATFWESGGSVEKVALFEAKDTHVANKEKWLPAGCPPFPLCPDGMGLFYTPKCDHPYCKQLSPLEGHRDPNPCNDQTYPLFASN